jgi:hypothetical protein
MMLNLVVSVIIVPVQDGYTPIHRACWGRQQRHTDTVKALLEDGKVRCCCICCCCHMTVTPASDTADTLSHLSHITRNSLTAVRRQHHAPA